MANTISHQFEKIESLQDLKDYLTQRIAHIKRVNGKLTQAERELQDILEMLEDVE